MNRAAAVVRLSEKSTCILCSSFQLSTSFKLETTHKWFTFGFGKTTYSIRIMPTINKETHDNAEPLLGQRHHVKLQTQIHATFYNLPIKTQLAKCLPFRGRCRGSAAVVVS